MEREKIFANPLCDTWLISEISKKLPQLNSKTCNTKNRQRTWTDISSKKTYKRPGVIWNGVQHHYSETQIKATVTLSPHLSCSLQLYSSNQSKGCQSWVFTWKDWCWSWNSNILATWCKELFHLKRPWCWERLKAGGEGDDRGWDGWMASPTQWTWVWVNSRSWWWTGRPGVPHGSWDHKESDTTKRLNWTEPREGKLKYP